MKKALGIHRLAIPLAFVCACTTLRPAATATCSWPSVVGEPRTKAEAACGWSLPIEQRSKIDGEFRIQCMEWALCGGPHAPRVKHMLIELVGDDRRELEAAGVELNHLFGSFYSTSVTVDVLMSIGQLSCVRRIHFDRPNYVNAR